MCTHGLGTPNLQSAGWSRDLPDRAWLSQHVHTRLGTPLLLASKQIFSAGGSGDLPDRTRLSQHACMRGALALQQMFEAPDGQVTFRTEPG